MDLWGGKWLDIELFRLGQKKSIVNIKNESKITHQNAVYDVANDMASRNGKTWFPILGDGVGLCYKSNQHKADHKSMYKTHDTTHHER